MSALQAISWFFAEYTRVLRNGIRQPFTYVWLLTLFALGLPNYGRAAVAVLAIATIAPALGILRLWSEGHYAEKKDVEKTQ